MTPNFIRYRDEAEQTGNEYQEEVKQQSEVVREERRSKGGRGFEQMPRAPSPGEHVSPPPYPH